MGKIVWEVNYLLEDLDEHTWAPMRHEMTYAMYECWYHTGELEWWAPDE